MFPAYVIGGKNCNERSRRGGFFYIGTAAGILAFDQAHCADYFKTKFTGGFDSLHGRRSGSAYVIHDDNARAFFAETLDTLTGAMLFSALRTRKPLSVPLVTPTAQRSDRRPSSIHR